MRAGQHVDADDTGDRPPRPRSDRPERAPPPRPEHTASVRQRPRSPRADEREQRGPDARPPPRHDVGEHRGRDRHSAPATSSRLDDPHDPARHRRRPVGSADRRARRSSGIADQQQDGLDDGDQAQKNQDADALLYRCLVVGVGEPGDRRDRIGRAAADPLRLRTDEQLGRLGDGRGPRGRSEPGRRAAGSRCGRCWSRSASRRRSRDRRRSRRAGGTTASVSDRPATSTSEFRRSGRDDLGEIGVDRSGLHRARGRIVAPLTVPRSTIDSGHSPSSGAGSVGQRRGVPVDPAERAGRGDRRAGADGDRAPDRLGQRARLGAVRQVACRPSAAPESVSVAPMSSGLRCIVAFSRRTLSHHRLSALARVVAGAEREPAVGRAGRRVRRPDRQRGDRVLLRQSPQRRRVGRIDVVPAQSGRAGDDHVAGPVRGRRPSTGATSDRRSRRWRR